MPRMFRNTPRCDAGSFWGRKGGLEGDHESLPVLGHGRAPAALISLVWREIDDEEALTTCKSGSTERCLMMRSHK